jgi:hypothetical protein
MNMWIGFIWLAIGRNKYMNEISSSGKGEAFPYYLMILTFSKKTLLRGI